MQTKTAALITAALLLVVSSAVGCSNDEDGSDGAETPQVPAVLSAVGSSSNEDGSNGTVTAQASVVTDSASLILSPDKLTISVEAATTDGSAVTVEGCTETTLASGTETILHAQGTAVILKGKITALSCRDNQLTALNIRGLSALQDLFCGGNQLTSLNVQGLSALKELKCYRNRLNAQALTSLLTGLPARSPSDDAKCTLYDEAPEEGNYTDFAEFTAPAELYSAVQNAVTKNRQLHNGELAEE